MTTKPDEEKDSSVQDDATNQGQDADKDKTPTKSDGPLTEPAPPSRTGGATTQKLYGEVLEKSIPQLEPRSYRHPLMVDALLAVGLLVAVGGITLGMYKTYITQEARAHITQRRYTDAIRVLRGVPLPGLFSMQTDKEESPEELLNQAYYLDAMEKLDANKNDTAAVKELEKIKPGSKFYKMANETLDISAPRSAITLEGNVEHPATAAEINAPEAKPLIPPDTDDK